MFIRKSRNVQLFNKSYKTIITFSIQLSAFTHRRGVLQRSRILIDLNWGGSHPTPRDLPPCGIPDGQERKRQSETPCPLGSGILIVVIVADHLHLRREDNYPTQEFEDAHLADDQIAFA